MISKQWLEVHFTDRVEKREIRPDPDNAQLGVTDSACPNCTTSPLVVRASSPTIDTNRADTLRGNGYAVCCGDPVGYVYAQRQTIFGLEEDRDVLQFGRARVYGTIGVRP